MLTRDELDVIETRVKYISSCGGMVTPRMYCEETLRLLDDIKIYKKALDIFARQTMPRDGFGLEDYEHYDKRIDEAKALAIKIAKDSK